MASIAAVESIGKAWKHPQTGEIRYYIEAEKVAEMAGISGEAYGRGERSLSKSQYGQLKACKFWLTADGELHIKGTLPTTCIDGMRTAEDLIREAVAEAISDDEPEAEEVTEEQEAEEVTDPATMPSPSPGRSEMLTIHTITPAEALGIIEHPAKRCGKYLVQGEDGSWIAIDNGFCEAHVEVYRHRMVAMAWLLGDIDEEDAHELDDTAEAVA